MMARTRMGLGIVECPAVIVGAAVTGVETSNLEAMSVLPETLGRLVAYRLEYTCICASDASDASDASTPRSFPAGHVGRANAQLFFRKWKSEYSPTKLSLVYRIGPIGPFGPLRHVFAGIPGPIRGPIFAHSGPKLDQEIGPSRRGSTRMGRFVRFWEGERGRRAMTVRLRPALRRHWARHLRTAANSRPTPCEAVRSCRRRS